MKRIAALILPLGLAFGASINPVRTQSGAVAGVALPGGTVTAYKGIPFAAAPVGQLRWQAPQPPAKWDGVRTAERFGANCVQTIVEEKKPWTHEFMAHGDVSEDCLFLNIWTPARAAGERRPVFVYLHGGANTEGSGSVAVYDGEGLAAKGVVMVTVNYRLGLFGFFSHPELTRESRHESSGNYALLDQIAALKWIRGNIAAFGGDPARVTVAGQSAGASDIALLTYSPLAKGLFQRAILESGGVSAGGFRGGRPLAAQEADGVKFAELKGAHSLTDLRAMSSKDLTAPAQGLPRFGPVTDGYVIPSADAKRNDVVTLAGYNADESGASPHPDTTAEKFAAQAKQRYGDRADRFLKLYPASNDEEARVSGNESARDRQRVTTLAWAEKTDAYVYYWNHALPGPDAGKYGAFHTSEVPYVLNTLGKSDRPFTTEDRKIADLVSSYWVNFATSGNPNGKGLPHWPSVGEQPDMVMELGDKTGAIPAASPARLEFLRH